MATIPTTEGNSTLHNSLSTLARMQMLIQKKLQLRQLELAFLAQKNSRSTVPTSLSQQLSEVEAQLWNHAELVLEEQSPENVSNNILELVRERQHFPIAETWTAFGERLTSVQRLMAVVLELLRSDQLQVLGSVRQNIEEAILASNRPAESSSPSEPNERIENSEVSVTVELGHALLNPSIAGENAQRLADSVKEIRLRIKDDSGIKISLIRICDSTVLNPLQYRILIQGFEVGNWTLVDGVSLAVGEFSNESNLVREPAYGLDAVWVDPSESEAHVEKGRIIVDPLSIISTHLESLLRNYLGDMLRIGHLDEMLAPIWEANPELLMAIQKRDLNAATVLNVFRELLREGLSLSNPEPILKSLSISEELEVDALLSEIRLLMIDDMMQYYLSPDKTLHVLRLSDRLQTGLLSAMVSQNGVYQIVLNTTAEEQLLSALLSSLSSNAQNGVVILLCSSPLRAALSRWIQRYFRWQPVLAEDEVSDSIAINQLAASLEIKDPSQISTAPEGFSVAVEQSLNESAQVLKDWIED